MPSQWKSKTYAPPGVTFSPEAFADRVGRTTDGCTIVAAVVAEDGRSVELTLETDREPVAMTSGGVPVYSIGVPPHLASSEVPARDPAATLLLKGLTQASALGWRTISVQRLKRLANGDATALPRRGEPSGRICVDPRCPAGRAHYGACPGPHRKDPS
jgi:hypothetical protein